LRQSNGLLDAGAICPTAVFMAGVAVFKTSTLFGWLFCPICDVILFVPDINLSKLAFPAA
jgi:hypothetical protein